MINVAIALNVILSIAAQPAAADTVKPVQWATLPAYSEGVVIDGAGQVFVSVTGTGSVYKVHPDGSTEVWAKTGGPNGHKVLPNGEHLVCDNQRHAVVRLGPTGELLGDAAKECDGKPLREPNDLCLGNDGDFYFTDPANSNDRNLIGSVHHVDNTGKVLLVADHLAYPNGIALSADGKTLYLAESKRNRILAYPVHSPGRVGPARLFVQLPPKGEGQVDNQPDGICLDSEGRLYVAHYGMRQVQVISPQGEIIRRYRAGNLLTSNVAFAGEGLKTLLVTGALNAEGKPGGLFKLAVDVAGRPAVSAKR